MVLVKESTKAVTLQALHRLHVWPQLRIADGNPAPHLVRHLFVIVPALIEKQKPAQSSSSIRRGTPSRAPQLSS
jgi:hypothetical protein